MKNQKTRLFQGMALIAAIMMIASFFMPWWMCKFSDSQAIWIHGWGLRHNLVGLASAVVADETPVYQSVLAWVYLGVSIITIGLCV
jgi:hypothetical protein